MKTVLRSSLLALAFAACASLPAAQFDLQTATVADINAAIDAGALSSEKLVGLYLKRIEAYDKAGPKINSVITLNTKALEEAKVLDAERKTKGRRSPLHGIPVVVKDLIDVAGMPTTAGFKPFGAPIPPRDATLVAKLKDAGAIILAKVSTVNWFGRDGFGPTHPIGASINPYNALYSPGGSSNGTGVSMAAYFATLGVGTDTGGSVQSPSAYNSIVGMVATQGLVSRTGIVPRGPTHDRAGPMGRSVYDIAVLLSTIGGVDPEDLGTYEGLDKFPQPDWPALLKVPNLQGKRIGVLREMITKDPAHAESVALFERALADLRKAGAHVVDPVLTGIDLREETEENASQYERIPFGDVYLARLGPDRPFKTMKEFMDKVGHDKFSDFYTKMVGQPPLDKNPDFTARLRKRKAVRALIDEAAERYSLDAFVMLYRTGAPPLMNPPPGTKNDGPNGNLTSTTGLPAVIMPGGYTKENLPVAIQFVGKSFGDLPLLSVAYGYEQISKRRKTPESTPPLPGESFAY